MQHVPLELQTVDKHRPIWKSQGYTYVSAVDEEIAFYGCRKRSVSAPEPMMKLIHNRDQPDGRCYARHIRVPMTSI